MAASRPTEHDHDLELEQDGRNKLAEIAKLKRFASVVNNSANIHTIHSLFLLEQKNTAVATEIDLFKWDDNFKWYEKWYPSLIKLAKVVLKSKITGHDVTIDEDAYWFRFEVVGGAHQPSHQTACFPDHQRTPQQDFGGPIGKIPFLVFGTRPPIEKPKDYPASNWNLFIPE